MKLGNKMAKLYTKTGDRGTTNLYDMRRVSKNSDLIEALGNLDELSSNIGMACALIYRGPEVFTYHFSCGPNLENLRTIQSKLLDIGSIIATTKETNITTHISEEDVKMVENWIDEAEKLNAPLKEFILVGVLCTDSQLHICRSVCRRAERSVVKVEYAASPEILQYLNRLSDYFFALARNYSGCREVTRSEANKK